MPDTSLPAQTDHVEAKRLWDDLQQWYQHEGWMKLNRSGDWEHVKAKDGDKPVLAARLLPKRLMLLHPSNSEKNA